MCGDKRCCPNVCNFATWTMILGTYQTILALVMTYVYYVDSTISSLSLTSYIFYSVMTVVSLLLFIFGSIFCYGTYKKNSTLMWPYLIMLWMVSTAFFILMAIYMFLYSNDFDISHRNEVLGVISCYLLVFVILIFSSLIMAVHTKRLSRSRVEPEAEKFTAIPFQSVDNDSLEHETLK